VEIEGIIWMMKPISSPVLLPTIRVLRVTAGGDTRSGKRADDVEEQKCLCVEDLRLGGQSHLMVIESKPLFTAQPPVLVK
jgi:hypothetical protein